MRTLSVALLLFCSLLFVALSADADSRSSVHIHPKTSLKWTNGAQSIHSIRGGATSSTSLNDVFTFAQKTWKDTVLPAIQDPKNKLVNPFVSFVGKQTDAAHERRHYYQKHGDVTTTSSTIFLKPMRIIKLVLAAWLLAELSYESGFLEPDAVYARVQNALDNLHDGIGSIKNRIQQWCSERRKKGGILRWETWKDQRTLAKAWQTQVHPKYRWAIGAAAGMILSPIVWSFGLTATFWTSTAFILAEVHHALKEQFDEYDPSQQPFLSPVDDFLEIMHYTLLKAIHNPKAIFVPMREDVKPSSGDWDFPPEIRRGLIVGLILGLAVGA